MRRGLPVRDRLHETRPYVLRAVPVRLLQGEKDPATFEEPAPVQAQAPPMLEVDDEHPELGPCGEVLGQGVAGCDVALDEHELLVDRPHEAGGTGHERGPYPPFGIPRRHHREALFLEKTAGHRRQPGADDLTHVPRVVQDPGPALDRELARMERPLGVSLSHAS